MTKKKLTQKSPPEIIILLLLLMYLTACSKKDQNNYVPPVFQIDLADTTYHYLLHADGSLALANLNIIVGYSGADYLAAYAICPVCGNTINFSYSSGTVWVCGRCGSNWDADGLPGWHVANIPLKVYTVSQSGNIITVYL
jgi:hypothetical protein